MVDPAGTMKTTKRKSIKSCLTGSAALFTWIFILNLTQVHAEGERCYVCGPRSSHWFSNGPPPSCMEFKPEPMFEVSCGKGYDYCAIIRTAGSSELSRVCVESHETKGCAAKACAKTKTLYTVCSCDGALCNGENFLKAIPTYAPAHTSESNTHDAETTTVKLTTDMDSLKTEPPAKHEDKSLENDSKGVAETKTDDTIMETAPPEATVTEKIGKSEESVTVHHETIHPKKTGVQERDLTNNVETNKEDTVTTHSLPLPEALGQEGKKKVPKQGAPVDDEEDNSEGSGTQAEEHKENHPTTHRPHILKSTTLKPRSSDASTYHITIISFWTLVALMIVS